MTDLDMIADERNRLQARLAELDIAERVILSLHGGNPQEARPPRGRKRDPNGMPKQYAYIIAILAQHGDSMPRSDLLHAVNAGRTKPMPEGTYAALLSKMATADLIVRADGHVSRIRRDQPV